jgi:hypothetical protein
MIYGPTGGSGGGEAGDPSTGMGGGGDTTRGPRRPGTRLPNSNGTFARCDCGRRIRIATTIYAAGPITCGLCGTDFKPA